MTDTFDPLPAHLADLTQGEHMLLWGFRAAAFGRGGCALVRRQFDDACGPESHEALTALNVFVRELGKLGRRKVTLSVPGSYRLSRDEQLILALFGAAQAEVYGRLDAHIVWLTAAPPRPPFAAAACLVAQCFAMSGLVLRLPTAEAPPSTRRSEIGKRDRTLKLA